MKKPILIISSDWHIKPSNIDSIIELIKQKIKLAKKLNCTNLACLGDIFQSRQSQPLSVLKCFEIILDLIKEAEMELVCISGNHDKTDYQSTNSFLDQFQWHPALKLIRIYEGLLIKDDIKLWFLPFFEEKLWLDDFDENIINKVKEQDKYKHILMSHQSFNGSVNNDGSKQENSLKVGLFKDFFKVFLGHFHNMHQIGKNIYHLPSIQANNFGENNEKGFTVLYDDGSHELIQSTFSKYETIKIDLDKTSKKDLNKLITSHGGSDDHIRFKLIGAEEKIKAIKKEEFSVAGIEVTCDITDAEYEALEIEQVELTKDTIKDEFKVWCDKNEKDYNTGIEYINKKFGK